MQLKSLINKHVVAPIAKELAAFEARLIEHLRTEFKDVRSTVAIRAELDDDPDAASSVKRMAALAATARPANDGNQATIGKNAEIASDVAKDKKTVDMLGKLSSTE